MSNADPLQRERFFATPEEYLAFEAAATEKHEWIDGEVVPLHRGPQGMAGGTPTHALIAANFIIAAGTRLRGSPCRAYSSDLRVRTPAFRRAAGHKGLYTYPDVTVVCGRTETEKLSANTETLTNPTLLVEVLSPATADYDRGDKFRRYQTIDAFREYVLIAQDKPLVTVFLARDGDWTITFHEGLDAVARLASVGHPEAVGGIDLPLSEIYAGVDFDDTGGGATPDDA